MPNRVRGYLRGGITGTGLFKRGWPLRADIIWRCGIAPLCSVLMVVVSFAAAQPAPIKNPLAGEAASNLPDLSDVIRAFRTARKWLDDFELPKAGDAAGNVPISGASGVCIILRRSGRVMGIGTDSNSAEASMLRRAVASAINQVLSDPALKSVSAEIQLSDHDQASTALALRQSVQRELGQSLTLELEVAGKLAPLVGNDLLSAASKLQPGLDGVALRHGQTWDFQFPARLRAANVGSDPAQLLSSLALRAGIPLKDAPTLTQRAEFSLYRFSTVTLTQAAASKPPFQTIRGDTVVQESAVTLRSVAQFADGLASHILASMWPDPPAIDSSAAGEQRADDHPEFADRESHAASARKPLGIMGDYRIVADEYQPLIAPPMQQALAAFALNRYAAAPGVDGAVAEASLRAARQILVDLSIVESGEDDPMHDPGACAAIIYAIAEQPKFTDDPVIGRLAGQAVKKMAESFDPTSGFVNRFAAPTGASPPGIAAHEKAMLAGAMARLLVGAPAARLQLIDAAWVRIAIDQAWRSTVPQQRIALLPWIGWAEADYSHATKQPLAHVDDMRVLVDVLSRYRVGSMSDTRNDWSPETIQLAGGFAFTSYGAGVDAVPEVTAQTLRPAAWMAGIMHESQLVPPELEASAWRDHLLTMRFLLQLSVRETAAASLRDPKRALGGVRQALWDSDQPVPAQALALIAAANTLKCWKTPKSE